MVPLNMTQFSYLNSQAKVPYLLNFCQFENHLWTAKYLSVSEIYWENLDVVC